ncbi:MAG: DUF4276 family protein [Gammaproteobacteria bacterium]
MIRMYVVCEGQTEETFVRDAIAPNLVDRQIYLTARLISTSRGYKGGGLSYPRVRKFILNCLKEEKDTIVTTFLDLYALDSAFPCFETTRKINDVHERVARLEHDFKLDISGENPTYADRFFPHIQPYEFEGLLFTDIAKLVALEADWKKSLKQLQEVRNSFDSPEHINDGHETKPSARLNTSLKSPSYRKKYHGPLAIQSIGVDKVCEQCRHFAEWYAKLYGMKDSFGVTA